MFILETIHTEGIAQLSYLLGDTQTRSAVVIDPRTDVEVYLEMARKHGLSITHIFETHIHADFISGSRTLADRVGTAQVFLSGEKSDYKFDGEAVRDGDRFDFGAFGLVARHTPGHTPEHLSFELWEEQGDSRLVAIFTGDSLFVGSAGRPDLLGSDQTDVLAQQLYETIYDYFLSLDDHVMIFPCHGAGSACGAGISDRLTSTIGFERRHNDFCLCHCFDEFKRLVIEGAPPVPSHYPTLKKTNLDPAVLPHLPAIPALPPADFQSAIRESGMCLVDTRDMLAFGGGHVPGAINIGDRSELSVWFGEMIAPEKEILLVVDEASQIPDVQRRISRTGEFRFAGYLAGGMNAWMTKGFPIAFLPQLSVHELNERIQSGTQQTVLDVRKPAEYQAGHIPGAKHYYVADMRHRISGLDRNQSYVVYCGSGYRASIASSLMKARGFDNVMNVPGSWKAWESQFGSSVSSSGQMAEV